MSDVTNLFSPLKLGEIELPNRVLMAPLTRNRAQPDGCVKEMTETYYHQRASAGLIVSEATQISDIGKGYLNTPGIYTQDHVDAWTKVTDAVHAGGGRIFCQLWHVGRISHVSLLPSGQQPVSASAIAADTQTFTENGFEQVSDPVALDADGIRATIADFKHAAQMTLNAGFDGIEVHAANGYLLDQFLQDGVNHREDEYGGALENRMRLLSEVLDEVTQVVPAGRVGVRLSPLGQANDISDSDPKATFGKVYEMLSQRNLAYLHVVESFPGAEGDAESRALIKQLRGKYTGVYIGNGGYDAKSAADAIRGGVDAVAFGRPFIANPDLPERYRRNLELNEPHQDTFYGGDETGYTDYPFADRP
ncbi:alkene reductase [Altericroceibacterium endophyticum]|uniref:Alkene reductase n=1 Tax=Altericroceibacterium endophyticum TaxID=1808508 RepID=A0A6I4T4D2_9SPHN|nr:alkene reductase [Altericroceibacterium endophyticum]MXO66154.1 alkene reductase [Altericroceibacterium endophyticum]